VHFAEHLERYLGTKRPTVISGPSFTIGIHDRPDMVTAVTDGLRRLPFTTPLPVEFACSSRPGQEDDAARLLGVFADRTVRSGAEVEYDDGLVEERPLLPGTAIVGLLAAPHPYADEMFNLYRDSDGTLSLQFITLVPLTDAEAEYLADHETVELFDLWTAASTDLLDFRRLSAV
jgi:hypothetical protein